MSVDFAAMIEALVDTVERGWEARGRARAALPEVALEAFQSVGCDAGVPVGAVLDALAARAEFGRQLDPGNSFGDPPFTLHFGPDYVVDLYFWHRPEVAIHNHSFDGAFVVLVGSSFHTTWSVEGLKQVGNGIFAGDVSFDSCEYLNTGSMRPIQSGLDFVHQVGHLDSPSISLLVRTLPRHDDPPIYDILPPGSMIFQTRQLNASEHKQLALLRVILTFGGESTVQQFRNLLGNASDLLMAWALRAAIEFRQDVAIVAGWIELEPSLSRAWVPNFLTSLTSTDTNFVQLPYTTDAEIRLFLLLTKATLDRQQRDALVRSLDTNETYADFALRNLARLAAGHALGGPLPPLAMVVLEGLVRGSPDHLVAAEVQRTVPEITPLYLPQQVRRIREILCANPLIGAVVGPQEEQE